MTKLRKLVMEDMGLQPKDYFTEEQISKMRSMKPLGKISKATSGSTYIKISDRNIIRED